MEELRDFFAAKNRRQVTCLFRIGSFGNAPGSAKRLDAKKRSAARCCPTEFADNLRFWNNSA